MTQSSDRYDQTRRIFNRFFPVLILTFWVLLGLGSPGLAAPARLLVLGDSLTAGYGLRAGQAFPVRLEAALRRQGIDVSVANGGVSGDTTAGGLARLDWSLAARPGFVIVALGANDGLRGLSPSAMGKNLDAIIKRLRAKGVRVLLAGMRAPPNLGPDYTVAFDRIFPDLARKHDILLYPFFLEGVAAQPALNQHDGIHPNQQGVAVMVDRIMPYVMRLLRPRPARK
jgi:acyl-CoA thioesterase-1